MGRKATVYDVAERAGVSIATVSFAFTKPGRVKRETVEAVMAAADELGYVPSASARGLARGRTGAIGIYSFDYLLDEGDETLMSRAGRLFPLYADEVQRGVQVECHRRGYALMLGGTRTDSHDSRVIEVAGRVDGLIAFAGAVTLQALKQVSSRIPVVELGGAVRAKGVHTVFVDNGSGMAALTRHLLADHDYRTFAYFGELGTPEFRQRFERFSAELDAAGLVAPQPTPTHPGVDASADAAVEELTIRGTLPDVIVCDTDQTALATMEALQRRGIAVPEGVAVTGFDGILAAQLSHPALTTVIQPMEAVGRQAVSLIADVLDGVDPRGAPTLECTLSIARSCGC
ncbi:MAG: LacI family DNA-binding transcriptional regulator [Microbacterium sp.]